MKLTIKGNSFFVVIMSCTAPVPVLAKNYDRTSNILF